MKLHLPVRLFHAVMACLTAASALQSSYASSLPTPYVAPEGYDVKYVKGDHFDLSSAYNQNKVAFVLQLDLESEYAYDYSYPYESQVIFTSYYQDYPAALRLQGGMGGHDMSFISLADLSFTMTEITYYYFGLSAQNLLLDDIGRIYFEGPTTAISAVSVSIYDSGDVTIINKPDSESSESDAITEVSAITASSIDMVNSGNLYVSGYRYTTASAETIGVIGSGDVSFIENHSVYSGGAIIANTLMLDGNGDITFETNESDESGGAVYIQSTSDVSVNNNGKVIFRNNVAQETGGAVCVEYSYGVPVNASFNDNESLLFADNRAMSHGGAIYMGYYSNDGVNKLSISGNGEVIFRGNQAVNGSAIYMEYRDEDSIVEMNRNGLVSIVENSGPSAVYGNVEMHDNDKIVISDNETTGIDGSASMYGNNSIIIENNIYGIADGGDMINNGSICIRNNGTGICGSFTISGNDSIVVTDNANDGTATGGAGGGIRSTNLTLENNRSILVAGNSVLRTYDGGAFSGGGISASGTCEIIGNGSLVFRENIVQQRTWGGNYGAAIYANQLYIADNESVYITENYRYHSYGTSLEGVRTDLVLSIRNNGDFTLDVGHMFMLGYGSTADCDLSAPAGCSINLNRSIEVSAATVDFNALYTNREGEVLSQTGDIIFTAKTMKDIGYGAEYIAKEATSLFRTMVQVHDGRVIVEEGAVLKSYGITVQESASGESTPTLFLKNGNLEQSTYNVSLQANTTLSLTGANVVTAKELQLQAGSTMEVLLSETNLTDAALTMTGALSVGQGVTLRIGSYDEMLTDASYQILSLSSGKTPTSWTTSNLTVVGIGGWEIGDDDLQWNNGVLSVQFSRMEWTNATGGNEWNTIAQNWKKKGNACLYQDGSALYFGDNAAGTLELQGALSPGLVVVENAAGCDYIWNAAESGGSINGAARIVKRGAGSLLINLNNSYTGGTALYGGTLIAGSANAFGSGDIELHGGRLDLAMLPMANGITASGGTLAGASDYRGELVVDGELVLEGTTHAGEGIKIQGGGISGDSITDTHVEVNAGGKSIDISSALTGSSTLTVNGGTVTLNGQNSYTGGTVVNNGTLIVGKDSSIGSGHITLNGGWLDSGGQDVSGNLTINGGTIVGGYVLAAGNTLVVGQGGLEMMDEIVLAGGNLHFEGTYLDAVFGGSCTAKTSVTVSSYAMVAQEEELLLADFGQHVNNISADSFEYDGFGQLVYDEEENTLSLALTDINVSNKSGKLTWKIGSTDAWLDKNAFEHGNRVVFSGSGSVQIEGDVEPAYVLVDIEKSLAFKTSFNKRSGQFSGSIVGSGCVVKRGTGKLTLNDGNTYSGGTFIEAGTVTAGGAGSFGSGDITISGGILDLKSKAVDNDISLVGSATIKAGKKYLGSLYMEGDLLKGSVLNIAERATLAGGTLNGTLSGTGTVAVTGDVELGTTGKITTNALNVSGNLTVSTKGLSMNTKTSAITVTAGGHIQSEGSLKAYFMNLMGGSVELKAAKAASMTLTDALTVSSGAKLSLNGKVTAKNITLTDSALNLTSAKLQTVTAKNTLTLNGDNTVVFDFDAKDGKTYKIFSFKSFTNTGADLYSLLGWEQNDSIYELAETAKNITLTVYDSEGWEAYMDSLAADTQVAAASDEERTDAAVDEPIVEIEVDPVMAGVADTLVQTTWGTAGASRAFGDTIANRGAYSTTLAEGKGAAWISTMGGSSRISSDAGHAGADYTLTGAAFGIEGRVADKSVIGLAIGNSWGKVSTFSAYPVDQDSTHMGIYGNHALGTNTTLSWAATHTRTESDGTLAGLPSEWTQDALQLDARLTRHKQLSHKTTASAFVGLQYLATDSGEYAGIRTGSLQNLRAEIGVGATHRVSPATLVYGELSFVGDMVRNNPTADLGGYRAHGANPGRAGINLGVGATHQLTEDWSVNASYNFELMQNVTSHSLNLGASYNF